MTAVVELDGSVRLAGEGERGYREIVEEAPDLFSRFDPAGRVLFFSRAVESLTGHTPESFTRDPDLWRNVIVETDRDTWDQAVREVSGGDARIYDLRVQHKNGKVSTLSQSLYSVRGADGRIQLIEGTARDLTAVRQLEALKARSEERASLDRLKSQLLANVSHELRTPLVSIKGYNELLLRGALGPITPRQKRGLEIAGANTERLIELIETLLDFARRQEERLELHTERFDARAAVEDAIRALEDRIRSRRLTLRIELGGSPLWVEGDRARLAQVFRAILGNAEKFTDRETGEILVRAGQHGAHVEVSVSDRGIGIPHEAQQKIFDRFYQVDASSTRRFGGAGLGLAMAKELVTLHGGAIRVDSQEGQGATFTVSLPLAQKESGRFETLTMRPVILAGADAQDTQTLSPLLEQPSGIGSWADVFWAHSEADLVRRARRHRPDLVLVAFRPPDGSVMALKRESDTSNIPIVVISDERRPVGRADLVIERGDGERLVGGISRLLGRAPEALSQPRGRPRVVVVEDEIEILDFTRFVLEREGYDVVCVTRSAEAMEAIQKDCGLLILDIALEGEDGLEIARQLKADPATRGVPILIMTALSGDEVRQVSLAAGAEGYLVKPFGVDEFLRQVRLHLRGSEAREST
jgi:PAS domain S-box-containing protein